MILPTVFVSDRDCSKSSGLKSDTHLSLVGVKFVSQPEKSDLVNLIVYKIFSFLFLNAWENPVDTWERYSNGKSK